MKKIKIVIKLSVYILIRSLNKFIMNEKSKEVIKIIVQFVTTLLGVLLGINL